MMKYIITILVSIFFIGLFSVAVAQTANIPTTVPTAPGANYVLLSTTTGKYTYVATSSLGITGGGSSPLYWLYNAVSNYLYPATTTTAVQADHFVATSTTATSVFPHASTSYLTVTGNALKPFITPKFPDGAMATTSALSYNRYDAFGIMDKLPSGKIYIIYRDGNSHARSIIPGSEFGIMKMITSDDGGYTWNASTTVLSIANQDIRNYAGGTTPTGRIIVVFAEYDDTNWLYKYIYSDDEGQTWSSPQSFSDFGTTQGSPYGQLITLGNGQIAITGYLKVGAIYQPFIATSSDNGVTWSNSVNISGGSSDSISETTSVYLGNNTILAVGRDDSAGILMQSISTDNGATWTNNGTFSTGASTYQVSPELSTYMKNGRRVVELIFPARNGGKLRLSTAYASDLITNGVSAWSPNNSWNFGCLSPGCLPTVEGGYPGVVHFNDSENGIGYYYSSATTTNLGTSTTFGFFSLPFQTASWENIPNASNKDGSNNLTQSNDIYYDKGTVVLGTSTLPSPYSKNPHAPLFIYNAGDGDVNGAPYYGDTTIALSSSSGFPRFDFLNTSFSGIGYFGAGNNGKIFVNSGNQQAYSSGIMIRGINGLQLSGTANPVLSLSTTGNVGIGTSSPTNKLEVDGTTYLHGEATTTGNLTIGGQLYTPGAVSNFSALTVNGSKGSYGGINFRSGSTNYGTLMVHNDGLNGIYNPADNGWIYLVDTSGAFKSAGNSSYYLQTNGNSNLSGNLTIGGNVGIGTTSPSNALEVVGNGYFTGSINVATTTGTSTFANWVKITPNSVGLIADQFQAVDSSGIDLKSNNGSVIGLFGAGGGQNATFYDGLTNYGTFTTNNVQATGTTASKFINASTTNISASSSLVAGYLAGAPSIIAVDNNGKIIATTTTAGGGVTSVSASGGLQSSGGATPNISPASGYEMPLSASTTEWNSIHNSITTNTDGYVLQASSTATNNVAWVATSSLGITGGSGSQTPWTSNIDGGGYNLTNVNKIAVNNGSYSTPSITFSSDSSTGIYNDGFGDIAISVGGSGLYTFGDSFTGAIFDGPTISNSYGGAWTLNRSNSVSSPPYTFNANTNTGFYHPSTNTIGVSTNGSEIARFTTTGLGIGTTTPVSALAIVGTTTTTGLNTPLYTPASSSATCTTGDWAHDASYIYTCTATNTWKRVSLSTF